MPSLKEALNCNSPQICRVSLNNHDSVLHFQQTDSSHRITEVLTHSSSMYRVHVGGYGSLPIFFIAMNVLGTYIVAVSRCLLYGDCLETPSLISWPFSCCFDISSFVLQSCYFPRILHGGGAVLSLTIRQKKEKNKLQILS